MQQNNRVTFNLSLRLDDPFERRLSKCIKRMPRGYGKLFFARIARLFGRNAISEEELFAIMMDFVVDVKPLRLASMPEVAASEVAEKTQEAASAVTVAAAATRARLVQAPLFDAEDGDDLAVDLPGASAQGGGAYEM